MSTILITDDSSYVVENLEKILTKAGHTVVAKANDGEEAYIRYKECKPDLVTMDITMPGIDGISAVGRILRDYPDAKIIMISARGKENIIYEALERGAMNYIVKPFVPEDVVKVVNQVLNDEGRE